MADDILENWDPANIDKLYLKSLKETKKVKWLNVLNNYRYVQRSYWHVKS